MTKIDGPALKLALSGFTRNKMARAWRNRSNITHWDWEDRAAKLGSRKLAPILYVACGELCEQQFDPASWPDETWARLAVIITGFLSSKPDKALGRFEYSLKQGSQ